MAISFATATALHAQWVDPRPRTHPILAPAAEMPCGAVRALAFGFDAAGNVTLYSGGDDKLVRRWLLTPDFKGSFSLEPAGKVLWPIYRDIRGVVYALDVRRDSQGERLAFGGVGAKPSQVHCVYADQPDDRQPPLFDPAIQARNAIYAVAFHPRDSNLLAVGHDADPHVLLWRLANRKQAEKKLATGCTLRVRYLAFNPAGTALAIAGQDAAAAWRVEVWDVATAARVSTQPFQVEVTGLGWIDDRTWRAASTHGLFDTGAAALSLSQPLTRANDEPRDDLQIRALATTAGASPAVAVYDPIARQTQVALADPARNTISQLEQGEFLGPEPQVVLAASGEGPRYIAAAGLAEVAGSPAPLNVIRVWRADDGKLVAQTPGRKQYRSAGASIANVAIVSDGERPAVAFAWGPYSPRPQAPLTHRFDLLPRGLERLPEPVDPASQPRDWDVRKLTPTLYYLTNPKVHDKGIGPVPVWGAREPKCCAVGKVDGKERLVALGYIDGILVCDLERLVQISKNPSLSTEQKRVAIDGTVVRSFYGHAGMITCLSFAADSRWLVSGALDGTIAAWSLEEIVDALRKGKLEQRSDLGVAFDWRNSSDGKNRFLTVLNDPPVATPGWEAGFKAGQQVGVLRLGGVQQPFDAKRWVELLNKPVPGREMLISVAYQGRAIDLYSTISHDPLWTLYPQFDKEWVVWTPPGNFEVKSLTDGLARLEFHLNLGGDPVAQPGADDKGSLRLAAPYFQNRYLGTRYRDKPGAPGEIEIATRGTPGIERDPQWRPVLDRVVLTRLPDQPRETYLPPDIVLRVENGRATLTAHANGPEPVAESQLWLNGKLIEMRELDDAHATARMELSATLPSESLRAGSNTLVAVAGIAAPGGRVYSRTLKPLSVKGTVNGKPRLHYVGVGVTRLDLAAGKHTPLQFAANDVAMMAEALRRLVERGDELEAGFMATLADRPKAQPPTESNIRQSLKELVQQARPDDLAIVFLAGHGVNSQQGFRFIAQDTKPDDAAGVSSLEIDAQLSSLPCRTLLMLDTCHAEGVEVERQVLDWPGLQLGPQIVAACGTQQTSAELRGIGFGGKREGHGLFTAALLEPLLGERCIPDLSDVSADERPVADQNGDARLSIEEWCNYGRLRTTQLAARLPERPKKQDPTVLPSITFRDVSTRFLGAAR